MPGGGFQRGGGGDRAHKRPHASRGGPIVRHYFRILRGSTWITGYRNKPLHLQSLPQN